MLQQFDMHNKNVLEHDLLLNGGKFMIFEIDGHSYTL